MATISSAPSTGSASRRARRRPRPSARQGYVGLPRARPQQGGAEAPRRAVRPPAAPTRPTGPSSSAASPATREPSTRRSPAAPPTSAVVDEGRSRWRRQPDALARARPRRWPRLAGADPGDRPHASAPRPLRPCRLADRRRPCLWRRPGRSAARHMHLHARRIVLPLDPARRSTSAPSRRTICMFCSRPAAGPARPMPTPDCRESRDQPLQQKPAHMNYDPEAARFAASPEPTT